MKHGEILHKEFKHLTMQLLAPWLAYHSVRSFINMLPNLWQDVRVYTNKNGRHAKFAAAPSTAIAVIPRRHRIINSIKSYKKVVRKFFNLFKNTYSFSVSKIFSNALYPTRILCHNGDLLL